MVTTSRVEHHLRYLTETIGERLIGTEGNHSAAGYIHSVFAANQLETTELCFACPAWERDDVSLWVDNNTLQAQANTFSPSCQIQAPYEIAFTLEQLRSQALDDRILVLCGELTQQPLIAYNRNAIYLPDTAREIGNLLREKHPLAVVLINQTPGYDVLMLEDPRLHIPSVTVSADDGVKILSSSSRIMNLTISSRTAAGETCHVVGKNLRPSGQHRVLLCAHYDTRCGTVGAFDNASGVAVLLTLAEHFAIFPPDLSLEFVAFSAEEYQVADTLEEPYLSQYGLALPAYEYGKEIMAPYKPSDLDNVIAVLNFDGVGHTLGTNSISTMACSEALKALIAELKVSWPEMSIVGGWPASNHYAFYSNGIPSIPFNSVGMNNVIHHRRDDMHYISSAKLNEVVAFAQKLIADLSDKTPAWSRAFDLPSPTA